jgi:paraquat-inducible protein B
VKGKPHPRVVGAFVLGAIALLLLAIVLLSSGHWFMRRDRMAVYFPGSVKGLNQGSQVTFRGVKVGEVVDVKAFLTGKDDPLIQIEAVIEIRGDLVEVPPGVARLLAPSATTEEFAQGLIARGIRARMMSASLLTGQRYIDLDFLPGEPARLAGLHPRYPELPTTPTAMEKLGDKAEAILSDLADLPLEQMLDDLRKALTAARQVLESPDLRETLGGANRSTRRLEATLEKMHDTLGQADRTLDTLRSAADRTGGDARATLAELRVALSSVERSLEGLDQTLRGTDDARLTATEALEETTRTMRALRNLVDYIQTHPEAVVLGKERAKEK